jgi:hypothetical protein
MQINFLNLVYDLTGLLAGGVIGYAFGLLQQVAKRRNESLEKGGKLKSAWSLMPGSGVRVAYLLITLVLVQLVCPLLFTDGTQWWVSGGLVASYGYLLYRELRMRIREVRA